MKSSSSSGRGRPFSMDLEASKIGKVKLQLLSRCLTERSHYNRNFSLDCCRRSVGLVSPIMFFDVVIDGTLSWLNILRLSCNVSVFQRGQPSRSRKQFDCRCRSNVFILQRGRTERNQKPLNGLSTRSWRLETPF